MPGPVEPLRTCGDRCTIDPYNPALKGKESGSIRSDRPEECRRLRPPLRALTARARHLAPAAFLSVILAAIDHLNTARYRLYPPRRPSIVSSRPPLGHSHRTKQPLKMASWSSWLLGKGSGPGAQRDKARETIVELRQHLIMLEKKEDHLK